MELSKLIIILYLLIHVKDWILLYVISGHYSGKMVKLQLTSMCSSGSYTAWWLHDLTAGKRSAHSCMLLPTTPLYSTDSLAKTLPWLPRIPTHCKLPVLILYRFAHTVHDIAKSLWTLNHHACMCSLNSLFQNKSCLAVINKKTYI